MVGIVIAEGMAATGSHRCRLGLRRLRGREGRCRLGMQICHHGQIQVVVIAVVVEGVGEGEIMALHYLDHVVAVVAAAGREVRTADGAAEAVAEEVEAEAADGSQVQFEIARLVLHAESCLENGKSRYPRHKNQYIEVFCIQYSRKSCWSARV